MNNPFFRVRKKRCLQKKLFLLGAMKQHKFWRARFRGKLLKSCKRASYKNGCRHLAENFLGKPQFFCLRPGSHLIGFGFVTWLDVKTTWRSTKSWLHDSTWLWNFTTWSHDLGSTKDVEYVRLCLQLLLRIASSSAAICLTISPGKTVIKIFGFH